MQNLRRDGWEQYRAVRFMPLLAAFVLLLACSAQGAVRELETLPVAGPSAEMLAMAAAGQTAAGPTFFYVATAVDLVGRESAFSNEASATLAATSTSVTVSWTASVSNVSGYNVYRGTTTGGPYKKINAALVAGVTSYVDPFPLPTAPTALTAKPN